MGLTEYRLGELLIESTVSNRNMQYGVDMIQGVSQEGHFISPNRQTTELSLYRYKIVDNGAYVYNATTLGNGAIAYRTEGLCIVSHLCVVFYLNDKGKELLDPYYLFMNFRRKEFHRQVAFRNFGSQRAEFTFREFSDITIDVPPIEIQRKYVRVYTAMTEHQRNLSRGLDDLRLVCDMYIEDLRRKIPCERIGDYIREVNSRNTAMITENVKGVNSEGEFIETRASMIDLDFHNYKIVRRNQFVYNPARINIGSIALSNDDDCIVSPMYVVFEVSDKEKLLPEYLQLWFRRREFQRSTWFYATGTVRDIFSFDLMRDVRIPIPDMKIQRSIANIYTAYQKRKSLSERLKSLIKDACPVLIKGATDEARQMI